MIQSLKLLKFGTAIYPLMFRGGELSSTSAKKRAIKLKELLIKLGPTYVKIGQILSVRFDLLPKEVCLELQNLLDHAQQLPFEDIEVVLKEELGDKYYKHIKRIYRDPIGVGSLGQVHLAEIEGGKRVAVKVLKPGVRTAVNAEIRNLEKFINLVSKLPQVRKLPLKGIFNEFKHWLLKEVDYSIEAANQMKFKELFHRGSIYVPEVYRHLSTDKVLVTELVSGISAKEALKVFTDEGSDLIRYKDFQFSLRHVVDLARDHLYDAVFLTRFIHGDPHPSNIIIMGPEQIAFIDFGITFQYSQEYGQTLRKLLYNFATNDPNLVVKNLLELDQAAGSEPFDKIRDEVAPLFEEFKNSLPEEYSPTQLYLDIIYRAGQMDIQIPTILSLIGKILMTYDGMLQIIDPKLNIIQYLKPLLEQDYIENMIPTPTPEKIKEKVMEGYAKGYEFLSNALNLPTELLSTLHDIKVNGVRVQGSVPQQVESVESQPSGTFITFLYTLLSLGLLVLSQIYWPDDIIVKSVAFANWIIVFTILIFKLSKK